MSKWGKAIRARYYWSVILLIMGLLLIVVQEFIAVEPLKNIITCVGTSLISAAITIFLIKFDILDLIQNNAMEKFGIVGIEDGRDYVFAHSDVQNIKARNWEEFLRGASDKTIDIVGISMYSFLITKGILPILYELSDSYNIRIIFANLSSQEVAYQSSEEGKPGKLQENINWLSSKILLECKSGKIRVFFSKTLPKTFIVRSGNKMIITPYLLNGPFEEPTIIASDKGFARNSYFDTYMNYIRKVLNSSQEVSLASAGTQSKV